MLDTRSGIGVPTGIIEPRGTRVVEVRSRVPVWPHTDGPRPEVSTLNLDAADQTRANHAIVAIAADGAIAVFAERGTHTLVDLTGAFPA